MGYSVVNFVILGAGAVFCFRCRFKKVQEYPGRESSLLVSFR